MCILKIKKHLVLEELVFRFFLVDLVVLDDAVVGIVHVDALWTDGHGLIYEVEVY